MANGVACCKVNGWTGGRISVCLDWRRVCLFCLRLAAEELMFQMPCFVLGTQTVSFNVGLVIMLAWVLLTGVMFRVLQRLSEPFRRAECARSGLSMAVKVSEENVEESAPQVVEEILEEAAVGTAEVFFAGGASSWARSRS